METVEGLHHVALRCNDLAGCERFYADVLGLPVLRRWPAEGGGDRSVWMSLGRGFLALERATRPVEDAPFEDAPAGWQVVALGISRAEREGWERRLARAGVRLARRTPYSLFFRDPEGNRVALSHWPEEA
ncbi:MAG TPA: VOC family protein [Anaeromyxobacteraceae bacterium]|nr:VOC family protein [Anaeromyxobacteraceae bacterium]